MATDVHRAIAVCRAAAQALAEIARSQTTLVRLPLYLTPADLAAFEIAAPGMMPVTAPAIAPGDAASDRDPPEALELHHSVTRLLVRILPRRKVAVEVVTVIAAGYAAWRGDRPDTAAERRDYIMNVLAPVPPERLVELLDLPSAPPARRQAWPLRYGPALGARLARWARNPAAGLVELEPLVEEILDRRLETTLGIAAQALGPELLCILLCEVDRLAARCVLAGDPDANKAELTVVPARLARTPAASLALNAAFRTQLMQSGIPGYRVAAVAPAWITAAHLTRLSVGQLRAIARDLAAGRDPALPRPDPGCMDVALLALTHIDGARGRERAGGDGVEGPSDEWLRQLAESLGEEALVEAPVPLAEARDALRRIAMAALIDWHENADDANVPPMATSTWVRPPRPPS